MDETLDRGFEQAGRGRKEDGQSLVICAHFGRQGIVSLARGGIDGDIAQAVEEFGNPAAAVIGKVFLQRGARKVAIVARRHFGTCRGDDLEIVVEQAVSVERTERGEQHALGEVPGGAEQQQAICRQVHAKDRGIMQRYPLLQRLSVQEPACQSAAFLFFGGMIARVFPPRQNSEAQGRIGSIIKQRAAGSFVSTRKPLRRDHEKGPRKGALRSSRYCRSTVEQPFPEIPHDHNS